MGHLREIPHVSAVWPANQILLEQDLLEGDSV